MGEKRYFPWTRRQVSGMLFAVVASMLWSVTNVIIRHLVAELHPVVIGAGLYFSALTFIVPLYMVLWSRDDGPCLPLWRQPRPRLVVVLAKVGDTLGFIHAVVYISATQTTILSKLNAVWTFLILFLFYRREVGFWSLVGSVVTFAGVYVIVGGAQVEVTFTPGVLLGFGLAIFCGLSMAVFSVALGKDPAAAVPVSMAQQLRFTSSLLGMVLLFLLPFALMLLPDRWPSADQLFWLWFGGAFCLGLVYYCYNGALQRISSLLVVVIAALTIPFTLLLERAFFEVEVTHSLVAGALLIVGGMIAVSKEGRGAT